STLSERARELQPALVRGGGGRAGARRRPRRGDLPWIPQRSPRARARRAAAAALRSRRAQRGLLRPGRGESFRAARRNPLHFGQRRSSFLSCPARSGGDGGASDRDHRRPPSGAARLGRPAAARSAPPLRRTHLVRRAGSAGSAGASAPARDELPSAVRELSQALGYAVLADAASGVDDAVAHADLILRNDAWARALAPDAVIRVGGAISSKLVQSWLEQAGYTAIVHELG